MMSISRAWDWNESKDPLWLEPSEECYCVAARWKKRGFEKLLDFGCGLGRHSVFFARQGFCVSAFDLSADGVEHLRGWASKENLAIDARVTDMVTLPYKGGTFDCLFAYHVISHTDSVGIRGIFNEIKRVVRPGGEIYVTLCSKRSWSFAEGDHPVFDENTIIKKEDGPENGVPHYYSDYDGAVGLLGEIGLKIVNIRQKDDYYFHGGELRNSSHWFVLAERAS